eukprot:CAMPEP_0173292438 /NCGR_PEP_ID=MMETSP1143-20121109/12731_1 /TAXON_ID=483371 /ORGANISM="non described non described, Strain CCMP2298" /LENGTH=74 /DNA_ID=CAMNT_0014231831 /DNA_START=214 /DNA_END=435 /DNA_ORIENTATION=-
MNTSPSFPARAGLLITTDIPTKQLILFLNDENNDEIVILDLDDTHVLIRPEFLDYVTAEVQRLFDQNTFERVNK